MRYVTCGAVAGRPAEAGATEEAGATNEEAAAAKRGQRLVFFMLFQILQLV